jgi:hypothetical protein
MLLIMSVCEKSPDFAILETDHCQLALGTRSSTSDCASSLIQLDLMSSLDISRTSCAPCFPAWEHGVNTDFAGIALEGATDMSLNDCCRKHIFEASGLNDISTFPTAAMKKQLAHMNHRN